MHETRIRSSFSGASWPSRLLLGLAAMVGAWIISCFYLVLVQQMGEPGLKAFSMDKAAALIAAITYLLFVVPVTALLPRWIQLRFAYLILFLSLGWSSLAFHTLFVAWPWTALQKERGPALVFFLSWFGGFTLCALAIYLLLLWRGARNNRGQPLATTPDA